MDDASVTLSGAASTKAREIDSLLAEMRQRHTLMDTRQKLRSVVQNSTISEHERLLAAQELQKLQKTFPVENTEGIQLEHSTNLYVSNIALIINEEMLRGLFAPFGTVTSVKILYARTPEEQARGRHSGFVSFASHSQAKRAKDTLNGIEIFGLKLAIG